MGSSMPSTHIRESGVKEELVAIKKVTRDKGDKGQVEIHPLKFG